MIHPQIVVYERDGRLARQLQPLAEAERWPLRESRQVEPMVRLLRQSGCAVLIVKLSRNDPGRELSLLDQVRRLLPDVPTVAVGEPEDAGALAGLCWDLGVSFALFAPLSRELLPAIARGLMRRAAEAGLSGGNVR
jgi:hypothetical protein